MLPFSHSSIYYPIEHTRDFTTPEAKRQRPDTSDATSEDVVMFHEETDQPPISILETHRAKAEEASKDIQMRLYQIRIQQQLQPLLSHNEEFDPPIDTSIIRELIAHGNTAGIAALIDNNKSIVHLSDDNGETLLSLAAKYKNLQMIRLLLNAGSPIANLTPEGLLDLLSVIDAKLFFTHKDHIQTKIQDTQPTTPLEKYRLTQCHHIFNTILMALTQTPYPYASPLISGKGTISSMVALPTEVERIASVLQEWMLETETYTKLCSSNALRCPHTLHKSLLALGEHERQAHELLMELKKQHFYTPSVVAAFTNTEGALEGFIITKSTDDGVEIQALALKPRNFLLQTHAAQDAVLHQLIEAVKVSAQQNGNHILSMKNPPHCDALMEKLNIQQGYNGILFLPLGH